MTTISQVAEPNASVSPAQVAEVVAQACPTKDYTHKKVLVIVPDGTRTAPVGLLFKSLFNQIGEATDQFVHPLSAGPKFIVHLRHAREHGPKRPFLVAYVQRA